MDAIPTLTCCQLCAKPFDLDSSPAKTFYVSVGKQSIGVNSQVAVSITARGQCCRTCFKPIRRRLWFFWLIMLFGPLGILTITLPGIVLAKEVLQMTFALIPLLLLALPLLILFAGLGSLRIMDRRLYERVACKPFLEKTRSKLNVTLPGFIASKIVVFKAYLPGTKKDVIEIPEIPPNQTTV